MPLSSDQYKRTVDAILAAFPRESELERAVFFGIGERLNEAAEPGKLSRRVFELVQWSEAKGWTLKLIRGLRKENAGNPLLRNIELELNGAPLSEPSTPAETPTSQEIPMSNFTQRVHPFHWEGLLEHLQKSLGCNTDQAKAFLNGLVEEDTTYVGFSKLDRDTIADSARGAVPGIKPVRINDAVQLLKLLTPGLRVSEKDGHLDITFNTLTAQWERITSPTCTLDGSLFASVDFPKPIVGWADGKLYPHDAKFDAEVVGDVGAVAAPVREDLDGLGITSVHSDLRALALEHHELAQSHGSGHGRALFHERLDGLGVDLVTPRVVDLAPARVGLSPHLLASRTPLAASEVLASVSLRNGGDLVRVHVSSDFHESFPSVLISKSCASMI